jgi:Tfp pilus assembly major pilin PilA
MKLSPAQMDTLFSGKPIPIKQGLDEASALKYLDGMRKIGVMVDAEPPLPSLEPTLILEPIEEEQVDPSAELTQPISTEPETHFPARSTPTTSPSSGAKPNKSPQNRASRKSQQVVYCRNCGKPVAVKAHRCQACGAVQKSESKGSVAVVIVVVVIALFFIVGILAAIAVPAYQDYVMRANVTGAITESERYRQELSSFVEEKGALPSSNEELGIPETIRTPHIAGLTVGPNGVMTIEVDGASQVQGKTLVWTPTIVDDAVAWRCDGGSLEPRHRPASCRGNLAAAAPPASRQVISASGLVSVKLPEDGWEEQFPEGAEFAYIHEGKDIGIVVVREPKADFETNINLSEYTELLIEYAFVDFRDATFERYGAYPIQNLPGRLFSFHGYSDAIPIRGIVASVEGQSDFYKVMAWTHRSRYERNYETMLGILESFKENPE